MPTYSGQRNNYTRLILRILAFCSDLVSQRRSETEQVERDTSILIATGLRRYMKARGVEIPQIALVEFLQSEGVPVRGKDVRGEILDATRRRDKRRGNTESLGRLCEGILKAARYGKEGN